MTKYVVTRVFKDGTMKTLSRKPVSKAEAEREGFKLRERNPRWLLVLEPIPDAVE